MKRIGILGGLGPEATADYYKLIIKKINELDPDRNLNYPEIIIYSVNMAKFISYLECRNYTAASAYLSNSIKRLEAAGADFAAISSNTPHLLFEEIQSQIKIPLVSIVDAVRAEAVKLNLKKLLLLGTKFTMNNLFYADSFRQKSVEIVVPNEQDIEVVHHKLFSELEVGIYKSSTREQILEIVKRCRDEHAIDGVILGCTEFPLLFMESGYLQLPFLNSSNIHVSKIVDECIS